MISGRNPTLLITNTTLKHSGGSIMRDERRFPLCCHCAVYGYRDNEMQCYDVMWVGMLFKSRDWVNWSALRGRMDGAKI